MERMNGASSSGGTQSGLEEEPRHRSPNENSTMEELFPWVVELLDETETPIPKSANCRPLRFIRTPRRVSNEFLHNNDSRRYIAEENVRALSIGRYSNGIHAAQRNASASNAAPEGSTSCPVRKNVFQAKHARSDSDSRRARQQLPRRSRGLNFQFINELESSIQVLQEVTWEFLNALRLLDRMCLLSFENMIMKQRMESMLQEELIRGYLHDNYLQEMARLHAVFQQQIYQQQIYQQQIYQQQIYQQPSSSHGRFNSSRKLNSQSANRSSKY